jgi:hypothetical protein
MYIIFDSTNFQYIETINVTSKYSVVMKFVVFNTQKVFHTQFINFLYNLQPLQVLCACKFITYYYQMKKKYIFHTLTMSLSILQSNELQAEQTEIMEFQT